MYVLSVLAVSAIWVVGGLVFALLTTGRTRTLGIAACAVFLASRLLQNLVLVELQIRNGSSMPIQVLSSVVGVSTTAVGAALLVAALVVGTRARPAAQSGLR